MAAYAVDWLLLLSGVRHGVGDGIRAGDAGVLRSRTHLPRRFWSLLWLAGTAGALLLGGKLLILG